jgi:hypothetical protein
MYDLFYVVGADGEGWTRRPPAPGVKPNPKSKAMVLGTREDNNRSICTFKQKMIYNF